jgi:hypothetical protein
MHADQSNGGNVFQYSSGSPFWSLLMVCNLKQYVWKHDDCKQWWMYSRYDGAGNCTWNTIQLTWTFQHRNHIQNGVCIQYLWRTMLHVAAIQRTLQWLVLKITVYIPRIIQTSLDSAITSFNAKTLSKKYELSSPSRSRIFSWPDQRFISAQWTPFWIDSASSRMIGKKFDQFLAPKSLDIGSSIFYYWSKITQ